MAGDSVQQIKDRLSIVDVVSPYVQLQSAGKNMKGKSPFTSEKTPSFYVSPDRGMYYCFSSSQGGDIFSFVQAMEGVDFKGALKLLAEKAGVELVPEDPKKKTQRDRQYDVLEAATHFFEEALTKENNAKTYLESRGVSAQTRAKWRIGYAPGPPNHGWRDLKNHLEEQQYTQQELLGAGLIKGVDTGKEPYDVFRNRLVFPIFDASGRVVAYSGRTLDKDSDTPKYVNSPETELFNKSEILYGYDKAKQGIRTFDFALIVEGQFDVVLSHQAGYTNTVAVSGTALTSHHVMLLQRLSNKVVLALDADRAGIAAVKRAADIMLARGIDVKVAKIPNGSDPADIIKEDPHTFKKIIGEASHVIPYLLSVLDDEKKDERTMKLKAREEVLPFVAKIPNRIDQEHFEHLVAQHLNTTNEAIHFEVERIREQQKNVPEVHATEAAPDTTKQQDVQQLLGRKEDVQQYLAVLCTMLPPAKTAVIEKNFKEITGSTYTEAVGALDPSVLSKLTFTLEQYCASTPERLLHEDIAYRLTELSQMIHKQKLRSLREELKEAEKLDDQEAISAIIQRISDIQAGLSTTYDTSLFEA